MRNTTLCYLEKNGKYLMLLRNKKEVDENKGKWIGVGGKFEEGESPEECVIREVREETGYELDDMRFRGLITFVSDEWGTEYMHLFTSENFSRGGKPVDEDDSAEAFDCNEGLLKWIPKEEVMGLNLWEGDREFLSLLSKDTSFFTMKLCYNGDDLVHTETKIY